MIFLLKLLIYIFFLAYTNTQLANEILVYADNISYDSEKNIIAKGNAKVISQNQIITSNLIIYNKKNKKFILPSNFNFKDESNNYYSGSSGSFSEDLNDAKMENIKLLLNDGSRIVGKSALRKNKIDIISKGSYSPCTSRINIKNFICPIWQLEGEKILHDSDKLFLYQKHSKMKIFNVPVFYIPYIVTPSPLRKERKSGFLAPTLNFNFLDTQVSQNLSLPYYINLDIDKELTFTPQINYGGGTNSSQRLIFDYNQIISGGNLNIDVSLDTTLENENNESWFKDGSIITKYKSNLNENFTIAIESAVQSSNSYLKKSDPTNKTSIKTSLSSTLNLNGYNLRNFDDRLLFNISTYQVVQNNEDNKTTPTVLPFINYNEGTKYYKMFDYQNNYQFYNIFRDISTADHSQKQKKIAHNIKINNQFYDRRSKIDFKAEIHNQYFETESKKIENNDVSSNNYRIFPMSGIFIETPIRETITNTLFTPNLSIIMNGGISNSNQISNEESTNNNFTITNNSELNRYSGTDKLDNSQRISYGLLINKNKIALSISQNYEFLKNSNFHKETGNKNYLSDLLSNVTYANKEQLLTYDIRYDPEFGQIKSQSLTFNDKNILGSIAASYIDEKKETNSILSDGNENINLNLTSNKFLDFNIIKFDGSYDLIKDKAKKYSLGYSYFDECFGVNFDFSRSFYKDVNIKPQDTLTLMFSFKNLGSYKSSNLAVSELDKQDIEWEGGNVESDKFN